MSNVGNNFKFGASCSANAERKRSTRNVFKLKGKFFAEHWRKGKLLGKYEILNGVTDVGVNLALDILFEDGTAAVLDWAIGMIDAAGFSALAAGDTMAAHAGWTEFVAYSEPTRPEWDPGSAAAKAITNAVPRDFNITGGVAALKGTFLCSDDTKSGAGGTLWATATFAADIPVTGGDLIKITYTTSGA